jgi:hypothetical protein
MSGHDARESEEKGTMNGKTAAGLALMGAGLVTTPLAAAEQYGDWQHTVFIYVMGAAIDGDVQIGDIEVPVDVSISELFDALEMGGMAAYRAENGTWSFTADATFVALGGTQKGDRGLLKGDVDMDQFTFLGSLGRRWTDNLEFLFSLGYFDLSTDVKLKLTNPVTGDVITRKASDDASWVDPLIGLQYNVPFAGNWRFNLRGDIGGFGIGSDLSYQVLTNFRWQASDTLGVFFGYRLIAFDYEDGKKGNRNYQRFDLTEQGPLVGLSLSF